MIITFETLAESHFPLLLKWLETPHVKAWWDQDVSWTRELIRKKFGSYVKGYKPTKGVCKKIKAYMIVVKGQPIGYIQIYNAYDFPRPQPLVGLPEKLGAFDMFIGEQSHLHQGIGPAALQQFLDIFCKDAYTHIFADPAATNTFAIKTYEKAGFKRGKHHQDTDEIWMIRESKQPIGNQCVSTKTGWWLKKGGSFTVIEEIMPAGASEIRHLHQRTEQFFYVLEGVLILELDGLVRCSSKNV